VSCSDLQAWTRFFLVKKKKTGFQKNMWAFTGRDLLQILQQVRPGSMGVFGTALLPFFKLRSTNSTMEQLHRGVRGACDTP
jgi:hypothetical protein